MEGVWAMEGHGQRGVRGESWHLGPAGHTASGFGSGGADLGDVP